ncbi:cytochrome ubiquinol oxidase subunit I [Vibrio cincinnatiensis]|uniref:cytochrome ubiquinol oxidase subunit I n=1 Tax=Vibrio cincinnatiensis TaxID=675 RepID=UPI0012ACE167|nr:cytochrome ubiquinol oxidase subunit I [Vibrio cincinnatiensis]MCG3721275.1 cytochrome ubiquinol oxidase subunit I [Vibrio cincinnatiensis]MCG3737384.1 cytochrome ubiquinol oxidase subunit I [Vibrio cincinnatiensis]MCG3764603.1 cytochrome ubiquinol oxidase subunit I [Vibrio cincinnatiensis]
MLDTLMLSRIQFAANISFHILFPTITIALAWILVFFKWRFVRTQSQLWLDLYYFWVKVFALTFALGVVSGITMSFQFGTNWPGFMEKVGNVAGPLLGYEVMTAFFMEATFLGVMLFGRNRVPEWLHTLATVLVAIGTSLSAFWILVLNSWMHTPTGYELINGVVHVTSWKDVILNPSMPYRLVHMLLASLLTACFVIAGISAYQSLRNPQLKAAQVGLQVAIILAAIAIPAQIFVGDLHGLNTLEHQPEKIAAMEGVWETEKGAPLLLFAWPDEATRSNHFEIGIPKLASLILTHELDGEIVGLNAFAPDHPPVKPLFFGFRIMVGMGILMLMVSWYGAWRYIRRRSLPKPYLYGVVAMTFSGWIATLAGWYVTEIGRQPWLVNGVLRTSDAVTTVASSSVAFSLTLYLVVYAVLLVAYIHTLFYLARQFSDAEAIAVNPPKKASI